MKVKLSHIKAKLQREGICPLCNMDLQDRHNYNCPTRDLSTSEVVQELLAAFESAQRTFRKVSSCCTMCDVCNSCEAHDWIKEFGSVPEGTSGE